MFDVDIFCLRHQPSTDESHFVLLDRNIDLLTSPFAWNCNKGWCCGCRRRRWRRCRRRRRRRRRRWRRRRRCRRRRCRRRRWRCYGRCWRRRWRRCCGCICRRAKHIDKITKKRPQMPLTWDAWNNEMWLIHFKSYYHFYFTWIWGSSWWDVIIIAVAKMLHRFMVGKNLNKAVDNWDSNNNLMI